MKYSRKGLATKCGVGIDTLRYYEKIELLPVPERGANDYRIYNDADLIRLKQIIKAKKYGFTLGEIKEILKIAENTCLNKEKITLIINNKSKQIEEQIADLNELKSLLNNKLITIQNNN